MTKPPTLLSGGNPQIPKGYGDAPVQAYIAASPGWKRQACARLDALVTAAVPGVRKAVKYNSPLYGAPDREDWFLSLHGFDRYLKVAFLNGTELDPPPPEPSKTPRTRYLHVRETEPLDEARVTAWIVQAAGLPGERL